MPLVLFNPLIGPYQVLPRRARVDLGAMAIKQPLRERVNVGGMALKQYCTIPQTPEMYPHHQTV